MDDKVIFKSDGILLIFKCSRRLHNEISNKRRRVVMKFHVLLYRYLGWEDKTPEFNNLPLILKPDGNGKLSKRDGDRLGFPVFPTEDKSRNRRDQFGI